MASSLQPKVLEIGPIETSRANMSTNMSGTM